MRIGGLLACSVTLSLLALSCDNVEFPGKTPYEISAASLTAEDQAIYEALVAAYAEAGQVLGMAPPPPGRRRPLSLDEVRDLSSRSNDRLRDFTLVRTELPQLPPDRWLTLTDTRLPPLAVPSSALRDFAARNRRRASLETYQSSYLRLKRTKDENIGSITSSVMSLTLPGYSDDRQSAVVEVWVSTSSLSGGAELHFLKKSQGVWRVVAKQLTMIS